MNKTINIFWFRRDLRLEDNVGLFHALNGKHPVVAIFIFDKEIIDSLKKDDPRVTFIHDTIRNMNTLLQNEYGSTIRTYYGKPTAILISCLMNTILKLCFPIMTMNPMPLIEIYLLNAF